MSFDKTSLVRTLTPKSYHFDGYNEVNCPNSRDRPFFCDNAIPIGDYHLSIRLVNDRMISIEFASVCINGKITFKPYKLSLEGFVSKLKEAVNNSCDFISFEITPEYNCNTKTCKNCNQKNKDCIAIRKTFPDKILAAVSFNMSEVKEALAMYFEITNQYSTTGGKTMKTQKNKFFGMNFEYGISKDPNIASTLMGVAVKNTETGNWYTFDPATNTRKNIANLKMGSFPIFLLPDKNLAVGDLIKLNGKYCNVKAIDVANNTFTVMDASDGVISERVPEESIIPGLNFYTKVVAFDMQTMSNASSNQSMASNVFAAICMMQWAKGNTEEFSLDSINDDSFNGLGSCLPALLAMNGGNFGNMFSGANGGSLGLFEIMALGGNIEGNDTMQLLVLSQLLGNNGASPFANILPSATPVSESGATVVCEKCNAVYPEGTNFCSKCGGKTKSTAKTCTACGATLKDGAAFCHKCGASATAVTCPKCGKVAEAGDAFCSKCGANLKAPTKITCPKCGNEVAADETFCTKCGLNQTTIMAPAVTETPENEAPANPAADN